MSVPPIFPPSCPPSAADAVPAIPAWAASGIAGQLSLVLQPPAWQHPVAERAAAPLVVVGHDYVGPEPAAAGWTAGLPPDDPFARLLAGLTQGTPDGLWLG